RLLMPAAVWLRDWVARQGWILDLDWIKWGLAAITLPVVAWSGQQFYKGTWSGLRHRTADMNTLIGVGTGAAYLYSLVATAAPTDRKSTRLNSSHVEISYAVFCLKKKRELGNM